MSSNIPEGAPPPWNPPEWSPEHRAFAASHWRDWGHICGYPECCIEAFVEDMLDHRNPAERGSAYTDKGDVYVPCSQCRNEADR